MTNLFDIMEDESFKDSDLKPPDHLLRIYLMGLDNQGLHTQRSVRDFVNAMSLVGGFMMTMYYTTYYTYMFVTNPFLELHLARGFAKLNIDGR